MTGISGLELELSSKRVGLLKETVPKVTPRDSALESRASGESPRSEGMQDAGAVIRSQGPVERGSKSRRACLAARCHRVGRHAGDPDFGRRHPRVRTTRHRGPCGKPAVPAIYEDRIFVEAGGLMSYGPNVRAMHRRAADYVDKILKGAKPGDIPFEQVSKFELVVNKTTASRLGHRDPAHAAASADEVSVGRGCASRFTGGASKKRGVTLARNPLVQCGGHCWVRTSDPSRVRGVLYR